MLTIFSNSFKKFVKTLIVIHKVFQVLLYLILIKLEKIVYLNSYISQSITHNNAK